MNEKFRRFNFRKAIENESFFTKIIKNIINKNIYLKKIYNNYLKKMNLINNLSNEKNELKIDNYLFLAVIISLVVSLYIFSFYPMWYVLIISFLLIMVIMIHVAILYISIRLHNIFKFFPIAIQCFTDEYVVYPNIKVALNNSYYKMPVKISALFENLSRELSSSKDEKTVLINFTEKIDYFWGYAFIEILLLSYEGAGNISKDLIYLNELINDQIKDELESNNSTLEIKLGFLIINIATIVALIFCLTNIPTSKEVYFYTYYGNMGLCFWVTSLLIGLITLNLTKYF